VPMIAVLMTQTSCASRYYAESCLAGS
jgi:hypothetical protein